MTMKEIATEIAKREGHKSQTRIGDIREILALLSELLAVKTDDVHAALMSNGVRRLKRKKV